MATSASQTKAQIIEVCELIADLPTVQFMVHPNGFFGVDVECMLAGPVGSYQGRKVRLASDYRDEDEGWSMYVMTGNESLCYAVEFTASTPAAVAAAAVRQALRQWEI